MSEPSGSISLKLGDRVVYPNQGVCKVTGIAAKEVAGQTLTFVTMKREEDGAVVMVPEAKVRAIGLRKVATAKEVDAIFDFLKSDSDKATLDWKQRARANVDRMSVGGLQGLAEVVKGLQVLGLAPLPAKERELYDNARHLLVAEVAASLNEPECNAEDAIDVVLFPPGRERPKRTVEEFKQVGDDDEGLGDLGDDLLALGSDLDLPTEEEAPSEPEEEHVEASEDEEEAPKPKAKPAAKKSAPPPKKAKEAPVPVAAASEPKPKRGRPPKAKVAEPAPAPKKRGRPPKPKPAAAPAPKKRGRPPKKK